MRRNSSLRAPRSAPKLTDGLGPALADALVDIDDSSDAGAARAPGDGPAMVAVGGAGDDETVFAHGRRRADQLHRHRQVP